MTLSYLREGGTHSTTFFDTETTPTDTLSGYLATVDEVVVAVKVTLMLMLVRMLLSKQRD